MSFVSVIFPVYEAPELSVAASTGHRLLEGDEREAIVGMLVIPSPGPIELRVASF